MLAYWDFYDKQNEIFDTPQPVVAVFHFAAALTQAVVTGFGLEIFIFRHVPGGSLVDFFPAVFFFDIPADDRILNFSGGFAPITATWKLSDDAFEDITGFPIIRFFTGSFRQLLVKLTGSYKVRLQPRGRKDPDDEPAETYRCNAASYDDISFCEENDAVFCSRLQPDYTSVLV